MAPRTLSEQLVKYLVDAHAIEEQALAQLRSAPRIAGNQHLAHIFGGHLTETEGHERLVRERLEAHDAAPSRIEDLVFAAGGKGFVLFARVQPDTPGKLAAHAFSFEHLEMGAYELLARVAERAGDDETAATARRIRDEEEHFASHLSNAFDDAVEASLHAHDGVDMDKQVRKYLADAHALEMQAIQLLQRAPQLAGDERLATLYAKHLEQEREHEQLVRRRLDARGARPNALKGAALRLGAINWSLFFQAQPDTPGKFATFAFAFEHLEIAGYEQLLRIARRAGDDETVALAERVLLDELAAAGALADAFDRAVDASLKALGLPV
jgi:ferritin-like metal-binding protein YciE